jgi:hypothetical protein
MSSLLVTFKVGENGEWSSFLGIFLVYVFFPLQCTGKTFSIAEKGKIGLTFSKRRKNVCYFIVF